MLRAALRLDGATLGERAGKVSTANDSNKKTQAQKKRPAENQEQWKLEQRWRKKTSRRPGLPPTNRRKADAGAAPPPGGGKARGKQRSAQDW